MLNRSRKKPNIQKISSHEELGFDYQIRLSQRKTAAIEIKREIVTVAAPFGSNINELHRWVAQKKNWIQDKLHHQNVRSQEAPQPQFIDDEQWLFMGQPLTLKVIYRSRKAPEIRNNTLFLSVSGSPEKWGRSKSKSA